MYRFGLIIYLFFLILASHLVGCRDPHRDAGAELVFSPEESTANWNTYDMWEGMNYAAPELQLETWFRQVYSGSPQIPAKPFVSSQELSLANEETEELDLLDYELTYQVRAAADKCSKLKWLRARITKQSDIQWLATKTNLKGLFLSFLVDPTKKIRLDRLSRLRGLRVLGLQWSEGLASHLPVLRNLDMLFIPIARAESLNWRGSAKLRVLDISYSRLNSDGIRKIVSNFPNLEKLNLYSNDVLDADDIRQLAKLKKLRYLEIALAGVSDENVRWLIHAMPQCEISDLD